VVAVAAVLGAQGLVDARGSAAQEAMDAGLPSVAEALLEATDDALLRANIAMSLGDAGCAVALLSGNAQTPEEKLLLGEALLGVNRPGEALAVFQSLAAELPTSEQAVTGAAQALAALGRVKEAGELFARLDGEGKGRLAHAAFLIDQGEAVAALRLLDAVAEDSARRDVLVARAALVAGDPGAALDRLERVRSPGPDLAGDIVHLKVEALLRGARRSDAEELLERLIENHPALPGLADMFQLLDALYAGQTSPSSGELRRWADDVAHPRRALLASYHLARNERRLDRFANAEAAFRASLEMQADAWQTDLVRSELSALLLEQERIGEAADVAAAGAGPRSSFALALARAAEGRFGDAREAFDAAHKATGWEEARINAALCALMTGESGPAEPSLRLASALRDASLGADVAQDQLSRLADEGSAAARLALAEWRLRQGDRRAARLELQQVAGGDAQSEEQASALAVFLEDDGLPDSESRILSAAARYRLAHPNGAAAPQVAFKEGEAFFRRGDYASARERFRGVVLSQPGGTMGVHARFLEAESAARLLDPVARDEALEIYEAVAAAGGPLAGRARLAQAFLLNATGRRAEALAVLENLASSEDPEIRFAALVEKGDALFSDPKADETGMRLAIASWRLVAEADAPAHWRNQAFAKIGAAHERLGEKPAAVASYYRALADTGEPELFWFSKAGFDAARVLESESKLDEAIAIYEILSTRGGPRSEEARQRIDRLRLENFLWEDQPGPNQSPSP
jgi:TolA-binding protein